MPRIRDGRWALLDTGTEHVLGLRLDGATGTTITLSNLADEPETVDLSPEVGAPVGVLEMFANRRYGRRPFDVSNLELDGWGYRWLRCTRALSRHQADAKTSSWMSSAVAESDRAVLRRRRRVSG